MKKKFTVTVILIICFALIAVLVYTNINSTKKAAAEQESLKSSIPEYVPDYDENGVDCAVIREGDLYDYLCETALNNGRLKKSARVETEDGRSYVYADLSLNKCVWIKEFTDEEAEAFIEAGLWDKLILNIGAEGFDSAKRRILQVKLQPYLDSAGLRIVSVTSGSGLIRTYEGAALPYKDKVIVYYLYHLSSSSNEYGYAVLDYEECKDWILPSGFKPDGTTDVYKLEDSDMDSVIVFFKNIVDLFKKPDEPSQFREFAMNLETYKENRSAKNGTD